MKTKNIFRLIMGLLVGVILQSCIGDDIIQDFVPEQVRIMSAPDSLTLGQPHQFMANFFNNVGMMESATITWASSDETILTIDQTGLANPLALGSVIVTARYQTATETLTDETVIQVAETVAGGMLKERAVTIATTSSYALQGTGGLKETASGDLVLEVDEDYIADTALPGLYVYLTNNPNTSAGALEIGRVTVFSGAHSYTISGVNIEDYEYVLYYCKPFNVKVGDGKLED
ncbi:MAG: hypothetical protein ACPGJS_19090 [Flammeovirgaceae bacterium]